MTRSKAVNKPEVNTEAVGFVGKLPAILALVINIDVSSGSISKIVKRTGVRLDSISILDNGHYRCRVLTDKTYSELMAILSQMKVIR